MPPPPLPGPAASHAPIRIAHRGMPRKIRENTLPSFALAMDSGADGLELDVHTTSDGVVVIHHDPELASGERIDTLSRDELGKREAAPGIAIPTLRELCELVRGRIALFVELKGAGVERATLDALAGYDGPFALHSFDHEMIRRARRLDARVRLGVLLEDAAGDAAAVLARAGATDLWPQHSLVSGELVQVVHAAGGRVIPWTVNEPGEARRLAAAGVDAICTDDVTMAALR